MNIGSGSETIISLGLGLEHRGGFVRIGLPPELRDWHPRIRVIEQKIK